MSIARDIRAAVVSMIVFTIVLGLGLPLLVVGISQVVFPGAANGSKIEVAGRVVGSRLIGQQFAVPVLKNGKPEMQNGGPVTAPAPTYFQSRPSATEPPYNGAASTFSNLGPNSVATEQEIAANIQTYLQLNKPYDPSLSAATTPVDAANSSASGLDPDISVANARIQARRIAALRHLPLARVDALVSTYTTGRSLGFFGEPGVNVLQLNLALNRLTGGH